ncbi:uncharacterized protein LOC105665009 [Ceratitis capitata]|uniref:uncharacterized protein LOC105665009 n=1 Tax=Ceratitis capitata TaxID=7213 RepID=UPI000A1221C8|nr:uncharacterized protein LOC105665009 [Ceratitis capitata]
MGRGSNNEGYVDDEGDDGNTKRKHRASAYLAFRLIFGGSLMADDSSLRRNCNWDVRISVSSKEKSLPTTYMEAATGSLLSGAYEIHLESKLHTEFERFNGTKLHAKYTEFVIGSKSKGYALKKLGNYTWNTGDGFKYHINRKFSTYEIFNCAKTFKGAWWFSKIL